MEDPIAQMDQALASMPDLAKMVFSYYDGLRAAGFNEGQAMVLACAWQTAVVQGAMAAAVEEPSEDEG